MLVLFLIFRIADDGIPAVSNISSARSFDEPERASCSYRFDAKILPRSASDSFGDACILSRALLHRARDYREGNCLTCWHRSDASCSRAPTYAADDDFPKRIKLFTIRLIRIIILGHDSDKYVKRIIFLRDYFNN